MGDKIIPFRYSKRLNKLSVISVIYFLPEDMYV